LGRLGGTPFTLGKLENLLEGQVLLPLSELNRLRREVVIQLDALRSQPKRWTIQTKRESAGDARIEAASPNPPQLIVLVRNLAQLDATLASEVETIYCEFEDPKKYREAVARFRSQRTSKSIKNDSSTEKNLSSSRTIWVAPPRIFKTGEEWTLKQVCSC